MSKKKYPVPIFPLDASADWLDDLENAIEASIAYQSRVAGQFGPTFAFAPLTPPANPDEWEPLDAAPKFLLLVSIERGRDALLLKAFRRAERQVGPLLRETTESAVRIDEGQPIADVFRQMEGASVRAFAKLGWRANDISRFFVRGAREVLALNAALGVV